MEKGIRNADTVAHKLGPASTRATNQRLEVAGEERRKREEMVERRKTEAMAAKCIGKLYLDPTHLADPGSTQSTLICS